MATATAAAQRDMIGEQRYEAYQQWERQQLADPRFASVRMLRDDLRDYGQVLPQTWERFDVEEYTWGAEVLNAPHSHIDRFDFDGHDIVVKEADGLHPRITMRQVYQNGLDKTRADVVDEPGLAFQLRRDELFMEFYEKVEHMMSGQTDYDTIHMVSTCPVPSELVDAQIDIDAAVALLNTRFYNLDRRKSFDYTARRLPNGQLELSATTLDSSDLDAHAAVLQASGHGNVNFAMLSSHEYGSFLSYDSTTSSPIEVVIASRISVYDAALEAQTGRRHRFGREDDTIDAHVFFQEHCEDYWVGYRAYNELLAGHLAGEKLHRSLQIYLLKCLDGQEQAGHSVLTQDALDRLRVQLWHGQVTSDMAMSCRELLVYDHHATLTRLLRQYNENGEVTQLHGDNLMAAYADSASSNGVEAAVNGETFAGCETATSVNSLSTAAQTAMANGQSLEQSLRQQDEEAAHCLRIQLYGYTIRRGVTCPFCSQKVDARDTQRTIECLNDDCRTVLNKATGQTSVREKLTDASGQTVSSNAEVPLAQASPLENGKTYEVGGARYRRSLLTVVGGAHIIYLDEAGEHIGGVAAEQLDALIASRIAAEAR